MPISKFRDVEFVWLWNRKSQFGRQLTSWRILVKVNFSFKFLIIKWLILFALSLTFMFGADFISFKRIDRGIEPFITWITVNRYVFNAEKLWKLPQTEQNICISLFVLAEFVLYTTRESTNGHPVSIIMISTPSIRPSQDYCLHLALATNLPAISIYTNEAGTPVLHRGSVIKSRVLYTSSPTGMTFSGIKAPDAIALARAAALG